MVVLNSALPGVGAGGIEDVDAASLALARAGNLAAVAGADFLLLACGSLHALLEGPHAIIPAVPVANWIERQAVSIGRSCKTVGIIGSRSARQTRVLARAVERQGAKAVNLDEVAQAEIDNIILHLMGGHCDAWAAQRLDKLSGQLVKGGCDGVWWGCTELALVPSHLRPANYRVFDPLRGMVDTALHAWGLQ